MRLIGSGTPVTVVAHGFGATLDQTRALVSGLPGTKVLYPARGHPDAPPALRPGYAELAEDLRTVADDHHATQAFGVSMGAGTILRLLSQTPTRLQRVVLFLPAAIDRPVPDDGLATALSAALRAGDADAVRAAVQAELPDGQDDPAYVTARTALLMAHPGLGQLREALRTDTPVQARDELATVSAQVLLLAQRGDRLHPAHVAQDLSTMLPHSHLHVFPGPAITPPWRTEFRGLVVRHLSGLSGLAPNG